MGERLRLAETGGRKPLMKTARDELGRCRLDCGHRNKDGGRGRRKQERRSHDPGEAWRARCVCAHGGASDEPQPMHLAASTCGRFKLLPPGYSAYAHVDFFKDMRQSRMRAKLYCFGAMISTIAD
jgi:hypothetical protein